MHSSHYLVMHLLTNLRVTFSSDKKGGNLMINTFKIAIIRWKVISKFILFFDYVLCPESLIQ